MGTPVYAALNVVDNDGADGCPINLGVAHSNHTLQVVLHGAPLDVQVQLEGALFPGAWCELGVWRQNEMTVNGFVFVTGRPVILIRASLRDWTPQTPDDAVSAFVCSQ